MDINKLYLFSKDTDAFSSQRGYNYQTLKTLETWVQNFVNDIKEDIYCEYEEDIFQKSTTKNDLKFRQIKLYSSNFSFSSDEVKKCIAHFFMLHVKSDYNDFTKEFVFETNTNIANKYAENDADLLKEWFKNQDSLDNDKLTTYAKKVKQIITDYINDYKATEKNKEQVEEAKEIFAGLDEHFWKNFVKMIKWKFLGISPEEEFSDLKSRVEKLILQLPYEFDKDEPKQILGVLLENVFSKVNEPEEGRRMLTSDELEKIMLNIGSEEDKLYASRFEYYSQASPIHEFRMGEFYEVINLVNYCRRKKYLHQHKDVWNPFLIFYSRNQRLHQLFRRKAIYELVFLNNEFYELDYDNLAGRVRPEGSLLGFEEDIRYYFSDFSAFKGADDLESARIIMDLLFVIIENGKIDVSIDELRKWYVDIYRKINRYLANETDTNERCKLLEQKGTYLLMINRLRSKSNIEFLPYFEEMLDLVQQAPLFKLSQFGDRIEKYIKIQIASDPKDEMGIIAALEVFSEKLFPLVGEREGKTQLAKQQVQRGYSYLKTTVPFNMLKALEYFHKAKENYQQEDTIEGFILALLNISQLYNAIGMHFAAKYYALASFRISVNHQFIKRTETSLAFLFHSDFQQGSWFNAITMYSKYMSMRFDSNYDPSNADEENMNTRSLSFILYTMSAVSHQFNYFIQSYFQYLNNLSIGTDIEFGDQIVKPGMEIIQSAVKTDDQLHRIIENKIDDFPLNDIGKERAISFFALGSKWTITFENSYQMLSIGEEYISTIQIVLAEIALSGIDFHLIKSKIQIRLELSEKIEQPEQIASNEIIKWKIYVVYFDDKDIAKINQHSATNMGSLMYILSNISLLESEEFLKLFSEFFKKIQLDTKQQSVNLYQKIHRDVYTEKDYDALSAMNFQKDEFKLALPVQNIFMTWQNSLSEKYNKDFAIDAIKNRFTNAQKCMHMTLAELRKDPAFPEFIRDLRNKGWKDWQIISNMLNFMINYKINTFEQKDFSTDQEKIEHLQKMFSKYLDLDENHCYVQFPLKAFQSEDFAKQFDISFISTLKTYGLESNLITPNFKAVKEFLDIRFNLANDNYDENNPFKEIS